MFGSKSPFSRKSRGQLALAIMKAETGNAGEIRIHIDKNCKIDPLERAAEVFHEMSMNKTKGATGVLILIALNKKTAAVWAGPGIHAQVPQTEWQTIVDTIATGFSKNDATLTPTTATLLAIEKIGKILRHHLASSDPAGNELSNKVTVS